MFIDEYELDSITDNPYLNEIYKEAVFIDVETTGLSRTYSDPLRQICPLILVIIVRFHIHRYRGLYFLHLKGEFCLC